MNTESLLEDLKEVYRLYRQEVDECLKKQRPTDGLFGLGHSLASDVCHDRFDQRLADTVQALLETELTEPKAEAAVKTILEPPCDREWPQAAQWMLRAAERHVLKLIPFLSAESAGRFAREYACRYKPWDRLPAQKQIYQALKKQA